MQDRAKLTTEKRNPRSRAIDRRTTAGFVRIINAGDQRVAPAVQFIAGVNGLEMTHRTLAASGQLLINKRRHPRGPHLDEQHLQRAEKRVLVRRARHPEPDQRLQRALPGRRRQRLSVRLGRRRQLAVILVRGVRALGLPSYQRSGDPLRLCRSAVRQRPGPVRRHEPSDALLLPTDKVYLQDAIAQTGDYIEIDFDGVARTATAVGTDSHGSWVRFMPALARQPAAVGQVCNWKAVTNYAMDLRVQAGRPAIGRGEAGAPAARPSTSSSSRRATSTVTACATCPRGRADGRQELPARAAPKQAAQRAPAAFSQGRRWFFRGAGWLIRCSS